VNDDDLALALERSVEARARKVAARPDVDDLLARARRRAARQHRVLVASMVAVLAVGGLVGYLIGQSDDSGTDVVVVGNGSIPSPGAGSAALAPADVDAARAEVKAAFYDAYAGGVSDSARADAVQRGDELDVFRRAVVKNIQRFGYTPEQLAGTTIDVADVLFIDETHAAVRFTVTIPGHGDVLADRVGYAVVDGGRWKVSLRTACDILSLNGLLQQCPPS
jgi:hypothetical protein